MNGEYQIYKRNNQTGLRDALIQRYTEFTLTLNYGTSSKFNIKGTTTDDLDLDSGDSLLFYRNGELLFSGLITDMSVNCKDAYNGKKEWSASGKDDGAIFENRIVIPEVYDDPTAVTFDKDVVDAVDEPTEEEKEDPDYNPDEEGRSHAYRRILHYIRRNMGADASVDRIIPGLTISGDINLGTMNPSSYRLKKLSDVIKEISEETDENDVPNNMYPVYFWNPENGRKSITIPIYQGNKTQRDMTDKITLSPEFGNVTAWTKTTKLPKFNCLWVCSGDYTTKKDGEDVTSRTWVYAIDTQSVEKYGRIENVITKSDIKVVVDDKDTEDVDETVTQEQVTKMLFQEADKQLKDNAYKKKYTITMVETPELQFWTDWKCGDLVTCVIEGTKFTSTIKTVEIKYAKGRETIKPTVGDVSEGEFSELFAWLSGIDTRVTAKELN